MPRGTPDGLLWNHHAAACAQLADEYARNLRTLQTANRVIPIRWSSARFSKTTTREPGDASTEDSSITSLGQADPTSP